MVKCVPFLLFDGTCAEAMAFYHASFGGELTLTTLGETPMKHAFPIEKHDRLINAHLESGAISTSATDWMASPEHNPVPGNTSAIFITAQTADELTPIFDKLSEGAHPDRFQALHELPIGLYGQFTDKYGVHWIFLSEHDTGHS